MDLKKFKSIKYDTFISAGKIRKFIFNPTQKSYIFGVIITFLLSIIFMIDIRNSISIINKNIFALITIFVTLLGFNLTGMALMLTTIDKKVLKFFNENKGLNAIINVLGNFVIMAFILIVEILIYVFGAFTISDESVDKIINLIEFNNVSVIITYIIISILLYMFIITLIFMFELCIASINMFLICKSKEIYYIDESEMNLDKEVN